MTISELRRSVSLSFTLGLGLQVILSVWASATASERVLHNFLGGSDGALPYGALIFDAAGNLYGTTGDGGTGTQCYDSIPGCGTLFEIAKRGGETVRYSFQGGSDGWGPHGSLLADMSGNLYGATNVGGGGSACEYGCGTLFKFAPDGTESVLYAFQGGSDGQFPNGSLIADESGNFYGMTSEGGNYNGSQCADVGCGTVFEANQNGTKNTLYAFQGGSDGAFPENGVIADPSGNLYGITGAGGGGSGCGADGCGTVFKLTPGGSESVLYAFQGGTDGEGPLSGLVADNAGNLYGTTFYGGVSGAGTVFEVSPAGQETVLYSFKGGSDGANPEAGLVMDANGNLYGTTEEGGGKGKGCKEVLFGDGCGTVFELMPGGKETVLNSFYSKHGQIPAAPLLLRNSKIYGTTTVGGKQQYGVVFEVAP